MSTVWNKILAELELQVSKAVFATLFKNTALVSIEKNVVTVSTPSPIVSSLIEKRYYGLLQQSLQNHLGTSISLVFTQDFSRISESGTKQNEEKTSLPLFNDGASDFRVLLRRARLRPDFTF
ncbi:MAG: DnaA N-terminal domain-containing protein, partial [Patescibacteria group bacterium]